MKKINKPLLIERLRNRLDLTDFEYEDFLLQENVILISSVDELLKDAKVVDSGNVSITSATSFNLLAVPAGKRWYPKFGIAYLATGTWTFDRFQITDNSEGVTVSFDVQAAGVVELETNFQGREFGLNETDAIAILVDSHTTTGNARMLCLIEEEDAW